MADPHVECTKIDVRYDPHDRGVAFAYIKGRWVVCRSERYEVFSGMSEKQIELLSVEFEKENHDRAKNRYLYGKQLAMFSQTNKAKEAVLTQSLKDHARLSVTKLPAGMVIAPRVPNSDKQSETITATQPMSDQKSDPRGKRINSIEHEFESFSF